MRTAPLLNFPISLFLTLGHRIGCFICVSFIYIPKISPVADNVEIVFSSSLCMLLFICLISSVSTLLFVNSHRNLNKWLKKHNFIILFVMSLCAV